MADKPREALDAIELLLQDHREVESLFKDFASLDKTDRDEAEDLIDDVCIELEIHDMLETEIFYPAVREAATTEDIAVLLDEAEAKHDAARDIIEQLDEPESDDRRRDALFTTLADEVTEHVEEEESELFPKVRQLKNLNLVALAGRMRERKLELMTEMGLVEESEEA